VNNIPISTAKETPPKEDEQFKVLGTDLVVSGVAELGKKLRDQWKHRRPRPRPN